jgi:anti-sigma factor RsiW
MSESTAKCQGQCPRADIQAFLDGELPSGAELELEHHLTECARCRSELNEQKLLLFAIDEAFDEHHGIDVPENFAKVVAVNAESSVRGLRCPVERGRALMVCAALALLLFFGLGADAVSAFGVVSTAADGLLAVGGLFAHLVSDIVVAFSVLVRPFCSQLVYKSAIMAGVLVVAGFALVFVLFRFTRIRRS